MSFVEIDQNQVSCQVLFWFLVSFGIGLTILVFLCSKAILEMLSLYLAVTLNLPVLVRVKVEKLVSFMVLVFIWFYVNFSWTVFNCTLVSSCLENWIAFSSPL